MIPLAFTVTAPAPDTAKSSVLNDATPAFEPDASSPAPVPPPAIPITLNSVGSSSKVVTSFLESLILPMSLTAKDVLAVSEYKTPAESEVPSNAVEV